MTTTEHHGYSSGGQGDELLQKANAVCCELANERNIRLELSTAAAAVQFSSVMDGWGAGVGHVSCSSRHGISNSCERVLFKNEILFIGERFVTMKVEQCTQKTRHRFLFWLFAWTSQFFAR